MKSNRCPPGRAPRFTAIAMAVWMLPAAGGIRAADDSVGLPSADHWIEKAEAILEEVPLIDGHNDMAYQFYARANNRLDLIDLTSDTRETAPSVRPDVLSLGRFMQTDIPRLRAGKVGGQFWSIYMPVSLSGSEATRAFVNQVDLIDRLIQRYDDVFEIALTADDVERIFAEGKIASLIGLEGGHAIDNSLAVLRMFFKLGARYMTLTHVADTDWADAATDRKRHGGLTPFGLRIIGEMNRLGMLVDLSHVSQKTMHDALDASEAPVIFSHSSARAMTPHPRNVPDDVLERLPANGGVVMVTFVPYFVSRALYDHVEARKDRQRILESQYPGDSRAYREEMGYWAWKHPRPKATLTDVADHIDHIRAVAGIDHIGIGSDFDGIPEAPEGLEDVASYPRLFAELLRRGYAEEDLKKIAGLNILRAMRSAEAAAIKLQTEHAPSDRPID